MTITTGTLTILGASARAAAQSARRAGWHVYAGDCFGDRDTQAVAAVERVRSYPQGLVSAARASPPGPWMYTGGLENHPELVDEIAQFKPLWGNAGAALRRARDPLAVRECLARQRLPAPQAALEIPVASSSDRWLEKPLRSCGGMNIRLCDGPIAPANSARRDTYFQQFIAGTAAAAIFVASLGEVLFLGLTRQLLGPPWAPCHSFQYAGSIGPLPAGGALARQLLRIGQTLAGEFELRGIFGVDGILRDDGFWTVEVNPRYTASVELLEWSQGRSALALHARAFGHEESPEFFRAPAGGCFGKLICFARRRARAGPRFAERVRQWNEGREFPLVADIPRPGEIIAAGHPVATVLAEAADELEVEAQLQARARQLDDLLEAPEA